MRLEKGDNNRCDVLKRINKRMGDEKSEDGGLLRKILGERNKNTDLVTPIGQTGGDIRGVYGPRH